MKNHAYLLGSFWNPEAVKRLTGEGTEQHISTDEEFEASSRMVLESNVEVLPQKKGRRRKRKIKE